jgi:hypothetical protein
VNKSLTNLDLENNRLGPEGGKALAKSLEVISIWMSSSSRNIEIDTFNMHFDVYAYDCSESLR